MSDISMASEIFTTLSGCRDAQTGKIVVRLRPNTIIGKTQDDPFDEWIGETLEERLPQYEVIHSGKLTVPDIIVRHRESREIIGIEVKKLDQKDNGNDSRGLTLDYNSCIPCGQMQIKIGGTVSNIRVYYLFALLAPDQNSLTTLVLLDGDFLNYDFDLHLKGKYANGSTYGHGSYGEGSVRGRAMYNYPNPLNSAIKPLFGKHSLIVKEGLAYQLDKSSLIYSAQIIRTDINGDDFLYRLYSDDGKQLNPQKPTPIIRDIFSGCKERKPKKSVAYMVDISEAPAPYKPNKKR